jgi:hypothetical protein
MRSQLEPPVLEVVKVLQPAARHSWGSRAIFLISGFEYCLRVSRLEFSLLCILALRYSISHTRAFAEKLIALLVEGARLNHCAAGFVEKEKVYMNPYNTS